MVVLLLLVQQLLLEIADSQELRRQSTKLLSILIRRERNPPSPCGWLPRKLLLFLRPHAEKGAWAILLMRLPSMVYRADPCPAGAETECQPLRCESTGAEG